LIDGFSIEITGKDAPALQEAATLLPPGTAVNVTYLSNEATEIRVSAAALAVALRLRPIPHLSARRLASRSALEGELSKLKAVAATEEVFLVGGDPSTPEGPFEDALAIIKTGVLPGFGVRRVGITGYPEGHPHISDKQLWQAMEDKVHALGEQGLEVSITTQFGFNAERVVDWIDEVRARNITAQIRVGVPGPAGAKRLLGYARRFGVASSAGIVQKYGLSLANLVRTVGPDRFVDDLHLELQTRGLTDVALHFYTFGGVKASAEWAAAKQGLVITGARSAR
jgi:methylenetetrahydrofolate reductase (NADPH)